MHPQSGPPSQPSMSASGTSSGPSPYAFDGARRRSLNSTSPLVTREADVPALAAPASSRLVSSHANLEQLLPTILHPTRDPRCRHPHRPHSNKRIRCSHNVLRTHRITALVESSLASARRIGLVAACPSRLSLEAAMQGLPLRHRGPRCHLPQTRHSWEATACSLLRLDEPLRLERDQTTLPFAGKRHLTGRCLALAAQGCQKGRAIPRALHPRERTASMAHRTLAGNLYRPRIKATGPQDFLHNVCSVLHQTTHWLEMPVSQPAVYHPAQTASRMALLGLPNEKG